MKSFLKLLANNVGALVGFMAVISALTAVTIVMGVLICLAFDHYGVLAGVVVTVALITFASTIVDALPEN